MQLDHRHASMAVVARQQRRSPGSTAMPHSTCVIRRRGYYLGTGRRWPRLGLSAPIGGPAVRILSAQFRTIAAQLRRRRVPQTAALSVFSISLAVTLSIVAVSRAYRIVAPESESHLPPAGYAVHEAARRALPDGGTFLAISENSLASGVA
jgi:hypothetical protein